MKLAHPSVPVLVILLFAALFPLAAQDVTADSLIKEIKDDSASWNVGFCRLSADGELSAAAKSLTVSLPTRWRESFGGSLVHSLTDDERQEIAVSLLEQARNKYRTEINQTIEERDKAWLNNNLSQSQDSDYAKKVDLSRTKLATLQRVEPTQITVVPRRPVNLAENSKDQALFDGVKPGDTAGPYSLADEKKIHTLVFGSISEEGEYVFIRLSAWDLLRHSLVWTYSQAMRTDDASSRTDDQIVAMAPTILGYEPATLLVKAEPASSLIILRPSLATGDLYSDVGSANFRFLEPGQYKLYIKADGYAAVEQVVKLEAGKTVSRSATLNPSASRFVNLESNPAGAAVYMFSRYQGITPVKIPVPDERTTVYLEAPGYQKLQIQIGPEAGETQSVTMVRDVINWSAEFNLRRDRLYDSLAWLAASCVLPIMFNGLYMNQANHFFANNGNNDEANLANLYYRLSLGTLVLTAVAIVDVALRISDYLEAADYLSGRN